MKTFLIFIAVSFLLIALALRLFENSLVFFPSKYPLGNWQPRGVKIEDCFFRTEDGAQLHGWFAAHDSAVATLLWCHGNAGNITDRVDNLMKLSESPVNIFIFDYRGYGRSEGSPNEANVYQDAVSAYDYLASRPDVDAKKMILFGRSLGGAVAVDLATQRSCHALILESTFTSAKDMAQSLYGPLPVHWIINTQLNSAEKIRRLHVPLLMLHGTHDSIVPFALGKKLFDLANEPKEFYKIPGADHNDTYYVGGELYFKTLEEFILRVSLETR
ncbi:MAG: alpha/beta hydrolase [bacterium]